MSSYVCIWKDIDAKTGEADNDSYTFLVNEEPMQGAFVCELSEYANSDLARIVGLLKYKNFNFKGFSFLKDSQIRLQVNQVMVGSNYVATSKDTLWTSELKEAVKTGTWEAVFHYLTPVGKFRKIRCSPGSHELQSWSGIQWVKDDIISRLYNICVSEGQKDLADEIVAHRNDLICLLTGQPVDLTMSKYYRTLAVLPVFGLMYVLTNIYSNTYWN